MPTPALAAPVTYLTRSPEESKFDHVLNYSAHVFKAILVRSLEVFIRPASGWFPRSRYTLEASEFLNLSRLRLLRSQCIKSSAGGLCSSSAWVAQVLCLLSSWGSVGLLQMRGRPADAEKALPKLGCLCCHAFQCGSDAACFAKCDQRAGLRAAVAVVLWSWSAALQGSLLLADKHQETSQPQHHTA